MMLTIKVNYAELDACRNKLTQIANQTDALLKGAPNVAVSEGKSSDKLRESYECLCRTRDAFSQLVIRTITTLNDAEKRFREDDESLAGLFKNG